MLGFFTFALGQIIGSGCLAPFFSLVAIAAVIYCVVLMFTRRGF